jgi:hypothetical protein
MVRYVKDSVPIYTQIIHLDNNLVDELLEDLGLLIDRDNDGLRQLELDPCNCDFAVMHERSGFADRQSEFIQDRQKITELNPIELV